MNKVPKPKASYATTSMNRAVEFTKEVERRLRHQQKREEFEEKNSIVIPKPKHRHYTNYKFSFDEKQLQRIQLALTYEKPIKIQVKPGGYYTLPLTNSEVDKAATGATFTYVLSAPKIRHIKGDKTGGFIPLLTLLPLLFGGLGAAGAVAGGVANSVKAANSRRAE